MPTPHRAAAGTTSASTARSSRFHSICVPQKRAQPLSRGDLLRVADLRAGHVRRREVEHLALAARARRASPAPPRSAPAASGIVLVVDVDAIGGEAVEADLARRRGSAWRAHPACTPRRSGRGQELRRDHDLVTARAERGAEELLRLAAAVHLGGVEVRDARVERGVDDGTRRVLVDAHAEVVAPEPHHREQRSVGAERACRSMGRDPRCRVASRASCCRVTPYPGDRTPEAANQGEPHEKRVLYSGSVHDQAEKDAVMAVLDGGVTELRDRRERRRDGAAGRGAVRQGGRA